MKFVIKNKDGQDMFYTEHDCCVPVDKLDSMTSSGFVFYVDNKKMSAAAVRARFKDISISHETRTEESKMHAVPDKHEHKSSRTISLIPNKAEELSKTDLPAVDFPITSRCVVCLQNNKVYKNQKEAAEDLNIDASWISWCITQKKEYKGYTFKKVVDLQ